MCLVRLKRSSLRRIQLDRPGIWRVAEAHWQIDVTTERAIKGDCADGTVVFAQVSPALCGGGMPMLDAPLVAAFSDDGTMTWWIEPGHDVAQALLRLPTTAPMPPGPSRPAATVSVAPAPPAPPGKAAPR